MARRRSRGREGTLPRHTEAARRHGRGPRTRFSESGSLFGFCYTTPVQRRVSSRGVIMVAGQRVGVGHAGITVTVTTTGGRFQVHDEDKLLVEVACTSAKPVARFKARTPEPPRQRTTTADVVAD